MPDDDQPDVQERICPMCGEPVPPERKRDAVYCSRRCYKQADYWSRKGEPRRIIQPDALCPVCGMRFQQTGRPPRTFCSARCGNKAKNYRKANLPLWMERSCPTCGKAIPSERNRKAVYCSRRCMARARQQSPEQKAVLKAYERSIKLRVIAAYGGSCSCCGETDADVLSIDHVHGGGGKHRLITGVGRKFYLWLEEREYPQGDYRLLCRNCNMSREHNEGVCPHLGHVTDPPPAVCVVCQQPLVKFAFPVCEPCRGLLRQQHGTLALSDCLLCGAPTGKRTEARRALFCPECRAKREKDGKRRIVRGNYERVIAAYGGRCAYCGEDELLFLNVDHVHGDGAAHRRTLGAAGVGAAFASWLIREGFPPGFQVLCWNCNWKKGTTPAMD